MYDGDVDQYFEVKVLCLFCVVNGHIWFLPDDHTVSNGISVSFLT